MKLRTLQGNLAAGLAIVTRAASRRSVLPVLSHVWLKAEAGRLQLAATDLEKMIVVPVGAKIEEEGAITVPAQTFLQLVKSLPPEVIDLEVEEHTLHVQCGRFEAHLNGFSADEFPIVPGFPSDARRVEMDAELLHHMVNLVAFAAGDDASRPVLSGVLCGLGRQDEPSVLPVPEGEGKEEGGQDGQVEKKFLMVASDGFRLSVFSHPLSLAGEAPQSEEGPSDTSEEENASSISVIVPARALTELARLCSKDEELVAIAVDGEGNRIFFQHQGMMLISQLIEGCFPDSRQIIPPSWQTRVEVDREALLQAVRMVAAIFAERENKSIRLSFAPRDPAGAGLVSIAGSGEMGDHEGEIEASVEGEKLSIAFSAPYLITPLSRLDSGRVVLEASTPTGPMVIRPLEDDVSEDYIHLVMPLHVQEERGEQGKTES